MNLRASLQGLFTKQTHRLAGSRQPKGLVLELSMDASGNAKEIIKKTFPQHYKQAEAEWTQMFSLMTFDHHVKLRDISSP